MVLCLLMPQSEYTEGVILGAVYNKKDIAPSFSKSHKIKGIEYEDGTIISYDKETSTLNVDCKNQIIIKCKNLNIEAVNEVNITCKTFNVNAEKSNFNHDIESTDLITPSITSINGHEHTTTKEGEPTSPPLP
ncbi:MAG: hypothetical protein ACRC4Y_02840 [Cetobacterium sp.]